MLHGNLKTIVTKLLILNAFKVLLALILLMHATHLFNNSRRIKIVYRLDCYAHSMNKARKTQTNGS